DQRVRLPIGLNLLIVDAWSIRILFAQWFALYDKPNLPLPALELSFRDYVLAEEDARTGADYKRAEAYWGKRLSTLPAAPDLPLAKDPRDIKQSKFVRLSRTLEPKHWSRLKKAARKANLTPSALLLAAFGTVLRRWSQSPRFSINVTVFNRRPVHAQVNELLGDFTSTMLVSFDGASEGTFAQRARRLQQQYWEDLDHAQYSGIRVVRDLMRAKDRRVSAAMPVVFTSIFGTGASSGHLLSTGKFVYGISQTPQVWLDHQVMEQGDALVLTWDAVEDLFPDGLLRDMFNTYGDLLDRLAHDPTTWEQETLAPLPETQQRGRDNVNATDSPLTDDCLHTLFATTAQENRDRGAVVCEAQRLSYGEVLDQAQQLARKLRKAGAQPGHPVAVVLHKGCDQVVAVLGILEVGAAYLPVDPIWPAPRLKQVLKIGEVNLAVTTSELASTLSWPSDVRCIAVDEQVSDDRGAKPEVASDPVASDPNDLAYVIFTSGSTGTPKGVMTDHRGAVNTILDINERFGIGADDRVLALSDLHFDLSVYDIFGLLAAGGAVVFPEPGAIRDPRRWTELILTEGITIWNTVPALMEMLVEHLEGRGTLLESLRLVMLSGDWIPVGLPDRIRRIAPNARIISLGGATEASIWSIYFPIERVDPTWTSIPYGKPLRNQRWHVLNEELEACSTWVPGDLYIAGTGLALGYWRDEERTRDSFIHHSKTGERLYRTGDRGRYLPDGNIEFLGRRDTQVKIRGHRIELGEIENALGAHPNVHSVVVAATGKDHAKKNLVGYVVLRKNGSPDGSTTIQDQDQLREHVAARLPCHMVPTKIVYLDALPLTSNGKVNREALPEPTSVDAPPSSPNTEGESQIVAQMSELIATELGVETVDLDANLMNLGADSVDIVRIANKIEAKFGFQPSLAEFFHDPTVRALAAAHDRMPTARSDRTSPPSTDAARATPTPPSRLILDPHEREAFKATAPGLRRLDSNLPRLPLGPTTPDTDGLKAYTLRRSQRTFAATPISSDALGDLLGCLRSVNLNGTPKYRYGSAGGLYAVQSYVHVKHGRAEGFNEGTYYYDPSEHALVPLAPGARIDPEVHEPFINRGIFEQAAFSIFLIAQLNAIEPLYGEHAQRFSMIEAGLIAQLLETEAPRYGIGLCQIGWLNFDRIRAHFLLDEGHQLVHSLVGGPLPDINPQSGTENSPATVAPEQRSEREEGEV
ncbi:MAG: amino acid adenylation domain-containing protein, partial [Planctomycetes bacterium]|nr:amino acid adenylation domain-containing protein [Planctomycetota bacterium]